MRKSITTVESRSQRDSYCSSYLDAIAGACTGATCACANAGSPDWANRIALAIIDIPAIVLTVNVDAIDLGPSNGRMDRKVNYRAHARAICRGSAREKIAIKVIRSGETREIFDACNVGGRLIIAAKIFAITLMMPRARARIV
jgi:hypothetical protein